MLKFAHKKYVGNSHMLLISCCLLKQNKKILQNIKKILSAIFFFAIKIKSIYFFYGRKLLFFFKHPNIKQLFD